MLKYKNIANVKFMNINPALFYHALLGLSSISPGSRNIKMRIIVKNTVVPTLTKN